SSPPCGCSLAEEGFQSLDAVVAREGDAEGFDLVLAAGGEYRLCSRPRCALRLAQGDGGFRGELFCELHGLWCQLGVGDYTVDQAEGLGLGGLDRVAAIDEVAGAGEADPQHQSLGAAEARNEAEVDLGLAEACFLGGDDEIAGECEFQAAAEG